MNELIKLEDIKAPVLFGSDDEVSGIIRQIQNSARSITSPLLTKKNQ